MDTQTAGTARHGVAGRAGPPHLPPRLVLRPRLDQRLANTRAPLTVVSGPVGAGKTVAVAAWARTTAPTVVWLTVEPGDSRRLWSRVAAALGVPAADPTIDDIAVAVAHQGTCTIVLDDVHHVQDRQAFAELEELVTWMPSGLRIVLTSREPNPMRLHRLRLWGDVEEIDVDELAFDAAELRDLFLAHGLVPDDLAVELLRTTSGGWPAVAALATRELARGETDPGRACATAVAEVLRAELAAATDEDKLVAIATVAPAPSELVAEVLGADPSEVVVDLREATAGLVLQRADGQWHVPGPIGTCLRARAQRFDAARTDELLRGAARWHGERGEDDDALQRFLAIGDQRGVRLIADHALRLHFEGRTAQLREWLDQVEPIAIPGAPIPTLGLAGAFALVGRADDAARIVATVRGQLPADPRIERGVHLVLSRCEQAWGHPSEALAHLTTALPGITVDDQLLLVDARLPLQAIQLRAALGDVEGARSDYGSIPALAASYGTIDGVLLPAAMATVHLAEGNLEAAESGARRALDSWQHLGLPEGEELGVAHRVLGHVLLLRNDGPVRHLELALAHARTARDVLEAAEAASLLARALHADGEGPAAFAVLDAARHPLHARATSPAALARLDRTEARLHLVDGNPTQARAAIDRLPEASNQRGLLEAWHAVVVGAPHRAMTLLADLDRPLATEAELDRALLLARAACAVSGVDEAAEHVRRAVTIGWADEWVQPFVDHGRTLEPLLRRSRDGGRLSAYTRRLLDAVTRTAPEPTVESLALSLTERERQVLRRLGSTMSNQEIAGMLDISLNTLKSHVKAIYRKLGAETRGEAVELAWRLRLDDDHAEVHA